MLKIRFDLKAGDLEKKIGRLFELSAAKIRSIEESWTPGLGSPVFTVKGRYTSASWTEWTQGFQFGSAILQFDATEDREFLDIGYSRTLELMAPHVTHFGVHDHGFNNISTYGNLLRLMDEGRVSVDKTEDRMGRRLCELALKCSGAVQAFRWTKIAEGGGYIYSFNGPHSLFIDTIRSLRSLAVAHRLGHVVLGEGDRKISLLGRLISHINATARFQHLLWRAARYLGCAGAGRAGKYIQYQRWPVSLSQHAAGLFAFQYVDYAGTHGVSAGLPNSWNLLTRFRTRIWRHTVGARRFSRLFGGPRKPSAITTLKARRPTEFPIGIPAHLGSINFRDGPTGRRIPSIPMSRLTAQPRPLRLRGCFDSASI